MRVRKFRQGSLLLLKVISLADGAVAIVLTQLALLSSQHSPNINNSTGLLGMTVGVSITLLSVTLLFLTYHKRKSHNNS